VVAEKILGPGEPLPGDWAVAGTTGYEFLSAVNGLFVDGSSERAFTRLYRDLTENRESFTETGYRGKRLILVASLAGELNMLTHQLDRIAQKRRRSRDFILNGLRAALREMIACFPVYRSYISAAGPSRADREHIETAARCAAARNPLLSPAVFRFVRDTLLLEHPATATDEDRAEQLRFAGKFQQVTSPVTAKGVEDTAFYIYNRLVSLNEVGGDPGRFGTPPEAVHRFNAERQANWPYALAPLSTHDTKRSEDVRARINVLSEMPDEWGAAVRSWSEANAAHRTDVNYAPAPDANEEYLLYQTLVGAWPPGTDAPGAEFADRIAAYMVKAVHEAKTHTSWVNPNAAYDAAVQRFVRSVLDPAKSSAFLAHFRPFQKRVARYGAINTLAQTLLKFTAPGVADTYQGTELPDFSLVDPDNRRPVDYQRRREMLASLREEFSSGDPAAPARELAEGIEDGRAKLYLTWRALTSRRENPGLFTEGEYLPLAATGARAEHLFAFARRRNGTTAVVAVPRLMSRLNTDGRELWANTRLAVPPSDRAAVWRDAFTGRELRAADGILPATELFAHFPVALLLCET
jgi:(1->4)-alpha-D-glucan 1-alpha-D-glucosylmutase